MTDIPNPGIKYDDQGERVMTIAPAKSVMLVFPTTTEYVDRNLATASWWDRYDIFPGEYVVEPVTIGGNPTSVENAYYGRVELNVVLRESYRVARLLHHSTAQHTEHEDVTTIRLTTYWYSIEHDGQWLGGRFDLPHSMR